MLKCDNDSNSPTFELDDYHEPENIPTYVRRYIIHVLIFNTIFYVIYASMHGGFMVIIYINIAMYV